jgi:hypothetical protein
VEKPAEAPKDSGMIKTTHFDGDKDQSDICTTSSPGDEIQSIGIKDLPTAVITMKGMTL